MTRVKISVNLKRPDELTIKVKGKFSRGNFVAITSHPIEYLSVGTKFPYVIELSDSTIFKNGVRYEMIITSGDLRVDGLIFTGTAVISLE